MGNANELSPLPPLNEKLDLELVRFIDAPPDLVWRAWTEPAQLKQWWTPRPWTTPECEIDPRPGGVFRTVMRSPEGEDYPNVGVYLEVVPNRRLAFTDALEEDLRPASSPSSSSEAHGIGFFTAIITFEEKNGGTQYTARALHADEAGRRKHEEMGFLEGWGAAAEQMAQVVAELKKQPAG